MRLTKIFKPSKGLLLLRIVALSVFAISTPILAVTALVNQSSPGKVIAFLVIGNLLVSLFSVLEIKKTVKQLKEFSSNHEKTE